MRLDKYLKVSRLIKRRTLANEACDSARISVNGRPAKASYQVKPGDVLELSFGQRRLRAEVLSVEPGPAKGAEAMYRELPPE
jgi:ribosomal 50S subunit-recycling heat shock protein